jgi:hypothetical protein
MSAKILRFKQPTFINDTVFFIFEVIKNTTFAMYDSGMGDPIKYGSIAIILGKLNEEIKKVKENKRKKFKVYWMIKDASNGWKENMQPPAGYLRGGIVDAINNSDDNSVHIKLSAPRGFPESAMGQIYWFSLGPTGKNLHFLYDSHMGSSLWGENRQKIFAFLREMDEQVRSNKREKYILWCFDRKNENEIWKKTAAKYLPKFDIESTKKTKIVEESKK